MPQFEHASGGFWESLERGTNVCSWAALSHSVREGLLATLQKGRSGHS
jgi:hypothetical protein